MADMVNGIDWYVLYHGPWYNPYQSNPISISVNHISLARLNFAAIASTLYLASRCNVFPIVANYIANWYQLSSVGVFMFIKVRTDNN